jgi:DNA-binding beta-propeller fold protein YncE
VQPTLLAAGAIRRFARIGLLAAVLGISAVAAGVAQPSAPYKLLVTKNVGGDYGRFDYVYADPAARRLYVARIGPQGQMSVFDLDTLASVGAIAETTAHGAVVDQATHHGFASSKPVAMWDSPSLQPIKTIDVQGEPDAIAGDPFDGRIYILSHSQPNATVIDAKDGTVLGTIDLGGEPEQMVSDGRGRLYVDLENKAAIAVIDAKTMQVTARYDLAGKAGECAGLAIDAKNGILFAACRDPQVMAVVRAADGKILATLPIGNDSDGAVFNPNTMEAFSAQIDGTLSIVKEESPTTFSLEQTLQTKAGAKTLTLDPKTNRIVLITADFTPPPSPPPGQRPGRPQMVPGSFTILEVGR